MNSEDPRWVFQAQPHAKVAAVFVHGIFGSTTGTWTNPNGKTFFDFLHGAPDIGSQVDIFAFGFTSNMFKDGSLDIREAANKLDQYLDSNHVWDYDTVVFVAHSMGGLIAMRELINNPEHREKVPLMVFYATPQEGSQITAIADHVVNNPAIRQMFNFNESEFLKDLDDAWVRIPEADRPAVICAYEKSPTYGFQIVTQSSATRFCGSPRIAIGGADHITIVKPDRAQHESVVLLVNELNKYVFGTKHDPLLETPDFKAEGDALVYQMQDVYSEGVARLINRGTRKLRYVLGQPSSPRLLVQPTDTPKDIPANDRDELKFDVVLRRGGLDKEVRFTLQSQASPERTIIVRIPGSDQAQEREAQVTKAVAEGINNFISTLGNADRLKALPEDQQLQEVAAAARAALVQNVGKRDAAVEWVLTADTLSSLGWPEVAKAALRQAEQQSPTTAKSFSVQTLAGSISHQSGDSKIFLMQQTPVLRPEQLQQFKSTSPQSFKVEDTQLWSNLSTQMQQVPSLKHYGLTVKGDMLENNGDTRGAAAAYRAAIKIKELPVITEKYGAANH